MGLTKQYLRYLPAGTFNIISSTGCNVSFVVLDGQEGRFLATGACENIIIWDLRLGEKAFTLEDEESEVTQLSVSSDNVHLAAGYANGKINIFDITTKEVTTVFSGHRTSISALVFDHQGHRLASGGKDTEIITWDMVAEAGIGRLSGHKGVITGLVFMSSKDILISASKDTYIKLWDLEVSHCFHTIAAHVTEVWSLVLAGGDRYLVAGSNDSELRVWSLDGNPSSSSSDTQPDALGSSKFHASVSCMKAGSILRSGGGRVVGLSTDASGGVLCAHGPGNTVEAFVFRDMDEAKVHWRKRVDKEKKKAAKLGLEAVKDELCLKDVVKRLPPVKCSSKVKSISVARGKDEIRIAASLNNNKLELHSMSLTEKSKATAGGDESKCLRRISAPGHQGEVRAVAFSSDNLAIASVGSSAIKMWNRVSLTCLRTIECDYALSVAFVPGDRHALVGLKDGRLLIVDLSAGEIIEEIPAHSTEVWAITLTPDRTCAVTAGGDSTVKVWQFELVAVAKEEEEERKPRGDPEEPQKRVLSLLHTRTLKLDNPALALKVSPCGKYLAVAVLDFTVKIFFMDTFKFFVSLYGHQLPILCTDISYDASLVVTGSADRNVKIWGLDFGDCHKSIFAHDDSVTGVAFVGHTHYFFSVGKDGKIKQWDADSFNKIVTLQGHRGEGWGLAVSAGGGGEFLVSCGQDRVLRLYEKSEEVVVLSDEQEEEREKEEGLATGQDSTVPLPSTKTVNAERGAENLMECLEGLKLYQEEEEAGGNPAPPPLMAALNLKTPHDYLGWTLMNIRASDLGESLLLLPLHSVVFLLTLLPGLISAPKTTETALRALVLLLRVHQGPLSVDTAALPLLERLHDEAFREVARFRDTLGFNLHALMFIQKEMEEREGVEFFSDASTLRREKERRKRHREKAKRAAAILSL